MFYFKKRELETCGCVISVKLYVSHIITMDKLTCLVKSRQECES